MMRTVFLLVFLLSSTALRAQFAWRAMEIPVRDGAHLAADLYSTDTTTAKPVILIQTPYNKTFYRIGTQLPVQAGGTFPLDTAAFNYVIVDWRGFYGSKDAAATGYDRGLDGYDAVEWIAAQRWCNGKVGTWGASALGAIQFQTARHHPPHLVCAVPLVKDFKSKYSDYYYGGEYRKSHVESLAKLGFLTTDLVLAHPTNDVLIQAGERATDHPEEFSVPMLMIGGWFDHYPDDVIRAFSDIAERSDPAVRDKHRFLFGPWTHSGVDKSEQGELEYPNSEGEASRAALRFFRYYLLEQENGWEETARVRYYQLGANEWREADSWESVVAAADITTFYLGADPLETENGLLSLSREAGSAVRWRDTLVFDPHDPSPTHGGSYFDPSDRNAPVGPYDQRDVVESRSDALLYTSKPLAEDLQVNGPVTVTLHVASDREDTDVAVRLCDVYPDGRSMLLTQGIRRMRFRNGFRPQDTALITPGEVYEITVELQNLAVTFLQGHRVRLIVTGSNYPHFDVNPNTAAPLYKSPDSVVATNLVMFDPNYPSRLLLPTSHSSRVPAQEGSAGLFAFDLLPNPASAETTMRVYVPTPSHLLAELYDAAGQKIISLLDKELESGQHLLPLNLSTDLPSGLYFCRLTVNGVVYVKEIVVEKR